jgi:predicted phage baseplate assembly protein
MPLPDPQLDDRRFQDIVNEAKRLIPRYCPEWTDHNVSDPGVTIIELFAWLADLLLYRINRVPEKNYLRFMDLLGISLKDAVPARTDLTFWLSAPQPGPVAIARDTEVATVRTGDRAAISFMTNADLTIHPPTLRECLFSPDDTNYVDYISRVNGEGDYADAFQGVPLPGQALYFGFVENVDAHVLSLSIDCIVEGIGVDPRDPPLAWEAWCGPTLGWQRCTVESDGTGGLNQVGSVIIHLPSGMEARVLSQASLHWVRLRVVQPRPHQPTYSASPQIRSVTFAAIGGRAEAVHSTLVIGEIFNRALGQPGETFELQHTPLLPRLDDHFLEVQDSDGAWQRWDEVESFRFSTAQDRHYTLDGVSGTISLGPTIRQPDGTERAYGASMLPGQAVRFSRYRYGGGVSGNVGANTLTVLKSSIPYVSRVTNFNAAVGGLDPESLQAAKFRAPQALRSQDRAVTPLDYEFLTYQASRLVARARCIQARTDGRGSSAPPGTVELLIVPLLPRDHPRTVDAFQPSPELIAEVRDYLEDRRMLGTQLVVDGAAYLGVRVEATIIVEPNVDSEAVRQRVAERLADYLDPLVGGADGTGWPFGRDLYLSEVQSVVQSVPGVRFAEDVTLHQIDLQTNQARAAGARITIADDVLLLPFEHTVTIARGNR